jgi:hypothetical protein
VRVIFSFGVVLLCVVRPTTVDTLKILFGHKRKKRFSKEELHFLKKKNPVTDPSSHSFEPLKRRVVQKIKKKTKTAE